MCDGSGDGLDDGLIFCVLRSMVFWICSWNI